MKDMLVEQLLGDFEYFLGLEYQNQRFFLWSVYIVLDFGEIRLRKRD